MMKKRGLNLNNLSLTREKRKIERNKLAFVWLLLVLPLAHFAIFFLFSNVYSLVMSFQTETGQFTLLNYKHFFENFFVKQEVGGYVYINAILYSFFLGFNDVLLVFISTILAYFIFKKIPGRSIFRVVYFLPSIIAMTIYIMVFKYLLNNDTGFPQFLPDFLKFDMFKAGTFANKLAVPIYCLWVGTGYNVLVIGGAMSNVSPEILENAKLEGVSGVRELFDIILPTIWPTLTVSFIGSIGVVFTLFVQVSLLTGGAMGTQTIAYMINSLVGNDNNVAAALGIIFTVVAIPVILLVKKCLDKIGKRWGY
ncbi:MAG: sugar ABC transporter permease [Bacilli bacterium]|nr:sugar ABC transporter permease [Bacilli bacterium]